METKLKTHPPSGRSLVSNETWPVARVSGWVLRAPGIGLAGYRGWAVHSKRTFFLRESTIAIRP